MARYIATQRAVSDRCVMGVAGEGEVTGRKPTRRAKTGAIASRVPDCSSVTASSPNRRGTSDRRLALERRVPAERRTAERRLLGERRRLPDRRAPPEPRPPRVGAPYPLLDRLGLFPWDERAKFAAELLEPVAQLVEQRTF